MKAITRIAIVGGGVAGSFLAALLAAHKEFVVDVFEPHSVYSKPCGEAVPVQAAIILMRAGIPLFKREIRAMVVCVEGKCRTIDFGETVGLIIDKRKLVDTLRRVARKTVRWHRRYASIADLQRYDLVVDARGPFSNAPEYDRLVAIQGYVEDGDKIDLPGFTDNKDTIHLWFSHKMMGYMWAFPSSHTWGEWNVGLGMRAKDYMWLRREGAPDLHRLLRSYFKEVILVQTSKIKIADPKKVAVDSTNRILRIGEAGGFVIPFTGEGIRPALDSAYCLYTDLLNKNFKELKRLAKEYKKHHRIYKLLRLVGPRFASRVLLKADTQTFDDLLSGRIGFLDLLKLLV